jgi:hypothetical protein
MEEGNWINVAWDENGKSCEGKIEAEGIVIDVYMGRLYVHDEKAWSENSGYGRYTIMDISEGQLRYKLFKIIVERGINNELFFAVEYNGNILTKNGDIKKQLIGISYRVNSGEDNAEVIEDAKAGFFYWLNETVLDWSYNIDIDLKNIKDFDILFQEEKLFAKEWKETRE